MNIDNNYLVDQLTDLLEIPSPTGFTEMAINHLRQQFELLGLKTITTGKGALIASIKGKDDSRHKTISAHADTLGAMVKEVKSNGRLKLTQLGGYAWNSIEGEYCSIHTDAGQKYTGTILLETASTHVHGKTVSGSERTAENMEVRIDEVVANADDIEKLGIEVGDFISFDPRNQVTDSGYVKSRHLDDKSCVAAILAMAKYIVDNKITPENTTHFFISNYEEVGHGASASLPKDTVELLAVDMAAPGKGQTSHEHKVTICAKDSSGPYDYNLKKHLCKLAKENDVDYVVDVYPFYGSDASAALKIGRAHV